MTLDIFDGFSVVTGEAGPPGTPGAAGIGLSFSNGYHASEILPGAIAVYPLTVDAAHSAFRSRTKPTAVVTFVLFKNTVRIGEAVMDPLTCGAGPVFNGAVTLDTPIVQIAADDLIDWQAPAILDATFSRGECSLGGPPQPS